MKIETAIIPRYPDETATAYADRRAKMLKLLVALPTSAPPRVPWLAEAYDPTRHIPPGVSVEV